MPILAIGGDHSYEPAMKTEMLFVAENVKAAVIENSGHWIMEEQQEQAVRAITDFIGEQGEGDSR
jgi:pimeloyl-ACP methyl ester carboxylesterase